MSKVLFFSDMHLDNWSSFGTITSGGLNSRFWEQIKVLEGLLQYAEKHDCKVVFGGDLFNRRMLVPTDVIHITFEVFDSYRAQAIYLLVGNHDMYTWNPEATPLKILRNMPHMNIITQVTNVYVQPSVSIVMVPHGALLPAKSAKSRTYDILMTHYGVNEARLGPKDFRMKEDLTVKQLKELNYDLIMLGHIHKPQTLSDDIIVMGSPMAHSFHEANEKKYFYIFDCEDKSLVKYETGAPMFLSHEIRTLEDLDAIDVNDGNYHRIQILSKNITLSDLEGYTGHNVVIARTNEETATEVPLDDIKARSPKEEVGDYYDALETELDRNALKDMSYSIIGDV